MGVGDEGAADEEVEEGVAHGCRRGKRVRTLRRRAMHAKQGKFVEEDSPLPGGVIISTCN